jgi:hypothetical protein
MLPELETDVCNIQLSQRQVAGNNRGNRIRPLAKTRTPKPNPDLRPVCFPAAGYPPGEGSAAIRFRPAARIRSGRRPQGMVGEIEEALQPPHARSFYARRRT